MAQLVKDIPNVYSFLQISAGYTPPCEKYKLQIILPPRSSYVANYKDLGYDSGVERNADWDQTCLIHHRSFDVSSKKHRKNCECCPVSLLIVR